MLQLYFITTEEDYKKFTYDLNHSLNPAIGTSEHRAQSSVKFAQNQGVSASRIIRSPEEMRYWLEGK